MCVGVRNVLVEVWQANSDGQYDPPDVSGHLKYNYNYNSPVAGGYQFQCRASANTGETGQYAFHTVMPGYYAPRPLHLHYKVQGKTRSSVHQMYFHHDTNPGKVRG